MAVSFQLAPHRIELLVGETKQFQVITPSTDYYISLDSAEHVQYNSKYKELTGLSKGTTLITGTYTDEDGTVYEDNISVVVTEPEVQIEVERPIKIMLHNRLSNRLTTLYSTLNADGDIIKLPSTSGILLTDTILSYREDYETSGEDTTGKNAGGVTSSESSGVYMVYYFGLATNSDTTTTITYAFGFYTQLDVSVNDVIVYTDEFYNSTGLLINNYGFYDTTEVDAYKYDDGNDEPSYEKKVGDFSFHVTIDGSNYDFDLLEGLSADITLKYPSTNGVYDTNSSSYDYITYRFTYMGEDTYNYNYDIYWNYDWEPF